MKFIKHHIATIILQLFVVAALNAQELSEISIPPNGDNEKAEVSQWIGLVKVTITYHSPDVHDPAGVDRKGHIWGELVHYGFIDQGYGPKVNGPWRAGANESSTISFSQPVTINNKVIAAGTYALFLDFEKSGPSYWILSSNIGWGSFQYDSKYDVLRIPTNPEDAPYTEWLTYGFDDRQTNHALAYLQWENKRFPFKIEVPDINQRYVEQMRKDLMSWPGFTAQNWIRAAGFCSRNKINLQEALIWVDRGIYEPFRGTMALGKLDFISLQVKAAILQNLNRQADADTVMDHAIRLPTTTALSVNNYCQTLLQNKRNERALVVALNNKQLHPEEKFWTSLVLARCYAANNNKNDAIKNWGIVLNNIPEDQKENIEAYKKEMESLKRN
jgi:tetratricopeptide (TPR) repeat protein